jgi:hypothetical protein
MIGKVSLGSFGSLRWITSSSGSVGGTGEGRKVVHCFQQIWRALQEQIMQALTGETAVRRK